MKNLRKTLKQIYSNPALILAQAIIFFAVAALMSYVQNIGQVNAVLGYQLPLGQKFILIQKIILYFYTTNLSSILLVIYFVVFFLFSYNIILTWYYFKKRATLSSLGSLSVSSILALLGSGCAACGGVLLTSVFSTVGGAYIVALLPYGGSEFLIVAGATLLYSIVSISKKIQSPFVC
jgi:hypothetical protein